MPLSLPDVLAGIALGAGATLLMDGWNLLLRRAFGIRSLDYCLLGRWLLHIPEGTLVHASIAAAPPKPRECGVGWLAHYTIGVTLALGFVVLAPDGWLAEPRLLPALLFGVATLVFPLFVLQPALGLGIASSRAPSPARARLKSLGTHVVFGLGLYATALVLAAVLP